MTNLLFSYFLTILGLVMLDAIWLGVVAKQFYSSQLSELLKKKFDLRPALLFYLFYAAGLIHLVIWPAYIQADTLSATISGAWLGLCAYGAYNFTNAATLKKWPVMVTVVDLLWGTFMTSVAGSIVTYILLSWLR